MSRYSTGTSGGKYDPGGSSGSGSGGEPATPASIRGLWACLPDVTVGDLVQISGEQLVEKADITISTPKHIIGFVYDKPTDSSCNVIYSGEIALSGLSAGDDYFAAEVAGAITTTRPQVGYVQQVGRAKSSTILVISIHKRVIL